MQFVSLTSPTKLITNSLEWWLALGLCKSYNTEVNSILDSCIDSREANQVAGIVVLPSLKEPFKPWLDNSNTITSLSSSANKDSWDP